jgi:hypothetical protein
MLNELNKKQLQISDSTEVIIFTIIYLIVLPFFETNLDRCAGGSRSGC